MEGTTEGNNKYDKDGEWIGLVKLQVIHYSTIDQLVMGKSVADVVEGLQGGFGKKISEKDVMRWMSCPLFEEEYLKCRNNKRKYTHVNARQARKKKEEEV